MVFRKQRTGKAEQTGKNRGISPYMVASFFLQDERGENFGKGAGVGKIRHLSIRSHKQTSARTLQQSLTNTHACLGSESVYYERCLLSFLVCVRVRACVCLWRETLRLALCGPDYNRISAAIYYTGLWTISDTVDQPELWGLKTSFNYTSAERKSTVTNSHEPLFTQCGEIITRRR